MITLIKQVRVFAPEDIGINDILIAGEHIMTVEPEIVLTGERVNVINGQGLIAMPGMVDSLVHITGGGGEGGFTTRTPEMTLTQATRAGVTTLVGALGTDATTRSLPDLVAKAKALTEEGITAYCYTGSYQLPARTITGNVTDDIVLIDPMIGVGEVAIADHRGSQPTVNDLANVASMARVGGMLSGKAGIVSIHTGEGTDRLSPLFEVTDKTSLPASQFYPTHINRNKGLLEEGIRWAKHGGVIDMTTSTNAQFIAQGEIPASEAVAWCLNKGIPASHITMSSDGNASLPVFDGEGNLIGLEVGQVGSLAVSLTELVTTHGVALSQAVETVSRTPARTLKLKNKGFIGSGADADILLCDPTTLAIHTVFARGRTMLADGEVVVKGTFE